MNMIRVKIGDQMIGVPSFILANAVMQSLPKFLTGEERPQGATQAAIKSGVKALMPLLLGWMHKEIAVKHLPLIPPDLKCKAARDNIITYAVAYIMANTAVMAEQQIFYAEGGMQDGTLVLTGLSAAPAALGEASDTGIAAGDERPAIAAPNAKTSGD